MSTYVKNSLTKVSNLAKRAKFAYLNGDEAAALEIIAEMETKCKFMREEIKHRQKVSA